MPLALLGGCPGAGAPLRRLGAALPPASLPGAMGSASTHGCWGWHPSCSITRVRPGAEGVAGGASGPFFPPDKVPPPRPGFGVSLGLAGPPQWLVKVLGVTLPGRRFAARWCHCFLAGEDHVYLVCHRMPCGELAVPCFSCQQCGWFAGGFSSDKNGKKKKKITVVVFVFLALGQESGFLQMLLKLFCCWSSLTIFLNHWNSLGNPEPAPSSVRLESCPVPALRGSRWPRHPHHRVGRCWVWPSPVTSSCL